MVVKIVVGALVVLEINEGLTECGGEGDISLTAYIEFAAEALNKFEKCDDVVGSFSGGIFRHPLEFQFHCCGALAVDEAPGVDKVGFVNTFSCGVGLVLVAIVDEVNLYLGGIVGVEGWNGRRCKSRWWGHIANGQHDIASILVICLHVVFDGLEGAPELIGSSCCADIKYFVFNNTVGGVGSSIVGICGRSIGVSAVVSSRVVTRRCGRRHSCG